MARSAGPSPHRLLLLVATLLVAFGCGRTNLGFPSPGQEAEDAGRDAAGGDVTSDLMVGSDLDPGGNLGPAPEIETPPRSAALDKLYCELDNGHLVQAALRAAACLDLGLAGVLDDASRGFVYGEMLVQGYAPTTYGNCDFLRCLSDATDCNQARQCQRDRRGGRCEGFESRCDGSILEVCLWNGEEYRWLEVQDCDRMGAECQESCAGPNCPNEATCVGPDMVDGCSYYGECDGDVMRRCAPIDPESDLTAFVDIDCTELVEDGTCRELPVGGEAPGPACVRADVECNTHFAEGFACGADGRTLNLCLFGQLVAVDCADYGYSACEDAGFFGVRCVP